MKIKDILIIVLCFAASFGTQAQETIVFNVEHDGLARSYRLVVPSNHADLETMPLVFNLHGFGSNAFQQEFYSAMGPIAEREGFLVCLPDGLDAGLGTSWNVGWGFESTADDVGFVSFLIDHVAAEYSVDQSRVYSCGMSNGGFMSYRLACELNDRIAAVASVTGAMAPLYLDQCNPEKAVPVMEIHGTNDATVGYEGTAGVNIPVEDVVSFWVENNGCSGAVDTIAIDDINMADNSTAIHIIHNDCNDATSVEFYKIDNGGHTWPGALFAIEGLNTNLDFNASEEIWRFFSQYSLETAVSTADTKLLNDIKLSPNPSSDILNISLDKGSVDQVQILDINGKKIYQSNGQSTINVRSWSNGMYYVKIKSGEQTAVKKFVKI